MRYFAFCVWCGVICDLHIHILCEIGYAVIFLHLCKPNRPQCIWFYRDRFIESCVEFAEGSWLHVVFGLNVFINHHTNPLRKVKGLNVGLIGRVGLRMLYSHWSQRVKFFQIKNAYHATYLPHICPLHTLFCITLAALEASGVPSAYVSHE